MARYTGPKARVNRRLGMMIYESGGAVRAMERRDNPPGMHTRPRRTSNYGMALREKQKIKHYYGLGEQATAAVFRYHFAEDWRYGRGAVAAVRAAAG